MKTAAELIYQLALLKVSPTGEAKIALFRNDLPQAPARCVSTKHPSHILSIWYSCLRCDIKDCAMHGRASCNEGLTGLYFCCCYPSLVCSFILATSTMPINGKKRTNNCPCVSGLFRKRGGVVGSNNRDDHHLVNVARPALVMFFPCHLFSLSRILSISSWKSILRSLKMWSGRTWYSLGKEASFTEKTIVV